MPNRLLVIECSEAFSDLWPELADRIGAELERTTTVAEAPAARPDASILACGGEEGRAIERIHEVHRTGLDAPLVAGASTDHRVAVQLMRAGAADYFALPPDVARLERELTAALSRAPEGDAPATRGVYDFSAIIGEHASLRSAIERAGKVIPGGKATVLLVGETGTGKELFARALHDNGPRMGQPFVAVNCSAIPGTLLESELFGHEKGAFTDARAAKPGLFELADGGTIFLDEVSSMPIELQAKLLRFLETRELRRVGGVGAKSVDVRIIAAANDDLTAQARGGAFREDLYYRLAVIPIELPPLRARGDDVVRLARHFVAELAASYGTEPPSLSRAAIEAIRRHAWPGNVRELRNAIERGLLLAGEDAIRPEHLSLDATRRTAMGSDGPLPFPATLETLERAAARATLDLYDGNKSRAARELGITRSRLYRILERSEEP
ncbi:MAG: sigma-54 dependent transcriptional regulator [Gemmatimonadetes bacterium]|nr:sigma-54 dependent transcriptional regulator [Gemmatimonadota bacterium]